MFQCGTAGEWAGAARGVTGRMFFFEKKSQKTFATWLTWPGERLAKPTKVFCSFSS
jgi:hypothetical protein